MKVCVKYAEMSFIKNIIDLRGILTLVVLTLPSIAANIDCNGKPFHCVNSTHFMICVDIGSGVSTTIDDFVIPCPLTTVCQRTNRFECEFSAVTTTVAPSVVPLVSVSETKETVTALYDVTTSIPFQEYNNTLSTTLSEDFLSTHQTIATEPTLTESTIVTDVKQNIEVIISESNSTLIETVLDTDVNNYYTTFKPLPMNTPAIDIEPITETTENVTGNSETVLTMSETTPSELAQNDLTTLAPLLTSAADLIPNATENINVITPKSETNSVVTDNAQNERASLSTSTGTLALSKVITTESILTEGEELTKSESTLSYTTPSSTFNDISLTSTSLPDNIVVNTASSIGLNPDTSDVNIITPEHRANSSVEVVQNNLTTLAPLLNNTSSNSVDLILNATENISPITPKYETNPIVPDNAQNEPVSLSTSPFANVITTESILTDAVEFTQSESTLSYTTPSSTFKDISLTSTSLPDNIPEATVSNTGLNLDAIDINITPEHRANSTSTESITIIEVMHNEPTQFPTSSSSVLLIDIADTTTESILTEVTESILIDSIGVIQNDVTINTPLSYNKSDNVIDLFSNATENFNVLISESETNLPLNETTSNLDVLQNDLTTPMPHNKNDNAADLIPHVTKKVDGIVPKSEKDSTLNENIPNSTNIVATTYLPNYNGNNVTESILKEITEINPSVSIDIRSNTALPDNISHVVTEPIVTDMTEKINFLIKETTQTLSPFTPQVVVADITQDPSKIAVLSNNITENKVTNVTDNTSLAETESVYNNTFTETISTESVDILNFYATTQSSISASLNNTDAIVAQPMITDVTENTNFVKTESISNLTLSGSLASESENVEQNETSPLYTQSVTDLPNITVIVATSATTDNVLTVLVNEINKANTTDKYEQNVSDGNYITVFTTPSIEKTSTTYQGSSVTESSNTVAETTPSSDVETTVSVQEIVPITHDNAYYQADTENIENDQRVFTTQTDGKFVLSEKVLSTNTIDNRASTPTLAVANKENLFISTIVSATSTEVTSEPTTDSLIDSLVLETHPSTEFVPITETPKEPTNSFEFNFYPTVASAEGIIARPALNNNNVQQSTESPVDSSTLPTIQITENVTEVITMEQTTLLTKLISTTQVSVPESVVSSDFLPSTIDVNNMVSNPKIKNILIETPTIAMTSTTTNSSQNLGSTESPATVIEIDVKNLTHHFGIKIEVDHDTTNNILKTNVKPTPETVNSITAESSVPIFSPITEVANKIYSYVEPAENKDSVTGKFDNTLNLTQKTSSLLVENVKSEVLSITDIIPDKTGAGVVDEQGLIINSSNATQTETANSITPELVTSSLHEPRVENTVTIAMAATTESMLTEKHNTNILVAENDKHATSVTEFSPVNETSFTKSTANILSTVNIGTETTKENNPLINLLLNSLVEQIPKEPAVSINLFSLDSIPIQNKTENNALENNTTVNENVALIGSTQQESYTKSIINHTDMSLQTSLLNAENVVSTIPIKGQGTDSNSPSVEPDTYKSLPQVTPENHTIALDITTKTKKVDTKSSTSPLKNIENITPHQDITTGNQIKPNVLTDIITEPTQQIPTDNDYEKNTPGTNKITATFLEQATTPSLDNLSTKLNQKILIATNTATTGTIENKATITDEYIMLKQTKTTETNIPTTFDRPIEVSKPTEVTRPYVPITSQLVTEQPMIKTTSTETRGTTPLLRDITTQTVSRPYVSHVVATQFHDASQYVTSPRTVDRNPVIGIQSTSELPTESWKVPQASEITVQANSKPNLIPIASNPHVKVTNDQTNNVIVKTEKQDVVSISETEFINIPKVVVTQSTRPVDTLNSNIDIVQINIPVLVENGLATGTHSGISVLQKPPKEAKPKESEQSEQSENYEKLKLKRKKEKGTSKDTEKENSEAPESIEGLPNNKPAIDTTSKYLKSSTGLVNEQNVNENIDLTETPKTSNSRSPTNKMRSKSTIEMTTAKIEEASISYESIANIELLSTTMKSTESFAQASTQSSDSSIKIEPTARTANINTSTARYSPNAKPRITNMPNATVTFKPATNTFICKHNSRGRFSDSKNCKKFYICFGKPEPIEGFCPNNTVFSELRKQCTKNLSHCVRNNQFQCTSEGRFSDYLNDNNYYICVKNKVGTFIRFKLQCQSGYHLNKTAVRCVLNKETSQSKSDISKNISDLSASSAKSEKIVIESSIEFECIKEGRFPDANNCRKYYICTKKGKSQYRRRSKKCDSDELFHKDKKKCVDADSYECS